MFTKKSKGQIGIEFIVLIAMLLLFFYSMLLPTVEFSETVVNDTYNIVKTHEALTRIATHMESFSTSLGYGKRDIFIYLPGDARITGCSGSNPYSLSATITVNPQNAILNDCDPTTGVCNLNFEFYAGDDVICNPIPSSYRGYITIEKNTDPGEISYYVSE
jgi:uncharacterized protein (UPF0333 family)